MELRVAAQARAGLARAPGHAGCLSAVVASGVCAPQARGERAAGQQRPAGVHGVGRFSDFPAIEAAYANRFKLIMVDEFQDTDQLQVNMIKRMAGEELRAPVHGWRCAAEHLPFPRGGGGMSRANDYAAALRAEGLPCVVAGGSIFQPSAGGGADGARLAQAVANP